MLLKRITYPGYWYKSIYQVSLAA